MGQVSWRVDDELLDAVRRAADAAGLSVNRFITETLRVATSEDEGASEAERMRHRLRAAGLLTSETRPRRLNLTEEQIKAMRAEASQGTSLTEIVLDDRR
ncbi:MAG: transcriptional regulator [Actinomycetota bacterium]